MPVPSRKLVTHTHTPGSLSKQFHHGTSCASKKLTSVKCERQFLTTVQCDRLPEGTSVKNINLHDEWQKIVLLFEPPADPGSVRPGPDCVVGSHPNEDIKSSFESQILPVVQHRTFCHQWNEMGTPPPPQKKIDKCFISIHTLIRVSTATAIQRLFALHTSS